MIKGAVARDKVSKTETVGGYMLYIQEFDIFTMPLLFALII